MPRTKSSFTARRTVRASLQGIHYRVLYFFHGAIAAVVAHGIVKEGAVPPKEIDRAIERERRFEANPAKHDREESTKWPEKRRPRPMQLSFSIADCSKANRNG
jgi:hypothetical protein